MKIKRGLFFIYLIPFSVMLTGCTDNSETEINGESESYPIVGEWLEDQSYGDRKALYTLNIKADGTTEMWQGLSNQSNSLYYSYSGTYTYDGSTLVQRHISPIDNSNVTEKYEVMSIGKYDMITYYAQLTSTSFLHRIINTYEMQVGEVKTFQPADMILGASSYSSTNSFVATVNNGSIVANKRGIAFIYVDSPEGRAAFRVVVKDPDNYVDDCIPFLRLQVNDVVSMFGSEYSLLIDNSTGIQSIRYNQIDELIESVTFSYTAKNMVNDIVVRIRESADLTKIRKSLDNKYSDVEIVEDGVIYTVANDKYVYGIYWIPRTRSLLYKVFGHPCEDYDDIIYYTPNQIAAQLGYTITAQDKTNRFFRIPITDNLYDRMEVFIDEQGNTMAIDLYCKEKVDPNKVRSWFEENYYPTGRKDYPYGNKENWVASDVLVTIKEDNTNGRTFVEYYNNYFLK